MAYSSVVEKAKALVAQSTISTSRQHQLSSKRHKKPQLEDGELVWIGEFHEHKDIRSYKLSKGDKSLMTNDELKLFAKTPYERGFTEYIYEGQVKWNGDSATVDKELKDPRQGTREGLGIMTYPHGAIFEGQWKAGKRHGHGYLSTQTGYKYTGEWAADVPEGKGYESVPSKVSVDGMFEHGVPQGMGVMLYNPHLNNYRYEGEFLNGRRHGKGVVFYDTGDTFAGSFEHGKRHGRGITTRSVNGRESQYETEWKDGELVGPPTAIEKAKRVKKPKSQLSYNLQGHLTAADLPKWTVKDDVTELSFDHFIRIKLGFEKLDVRGTGSLSTSELQAVWGAEGKAQSMLEKLDEDGNGTVELDEIFAAWYPNITQHNVNRFMQLHIDPKVLLRLRGTLCGVESREKCGYTQLVGMEAPAKNSTEDDDEEKPLTLRALEAADYHIGKEKFTAAMYDAARQITDPPFFSEILEVWYPNVPRSTLDRYECQHIDADELTRIKQDFYRLSGNEAALKLEEFEQAQEVFRKSIERRHNYDTAAAEGKKPKEEPKEEFTNAIQQSMIPGFFKDQPFWAVGNRIFISVSLLKDADRFDSKLSGRIEFSQLMHYCFPNVRCRRLQDVLEGGKKKSAGTCYFCTSS
jgi:hypothetical protein